MFGLFLLFQALLNNAVNICEEFPFPHSLPTWFCCRSSRAIPGAPLTCVVNIVEGLLPQREIPFPTSLVNASLASAWRSTGLWAGGQWLSAGDVPEMVCVCRLEWTKLDNRETVGRISCFQMFSESRSDLFNSWTKVLPVVVVVVRGRSEETDFVKERNLSIEVINTFNNLYFWWTHTQLYPILTISIHIILLFQVSVFLLTIGERKSWGN